MTLKNITFKSYLIYIYKIIGEKWIKGIRDDWFYLIEKNLSYIFQDFNIIQRLYIRIKYILVIPVQMFEEKLF